MIIGSVPLYNVMAVVVLSFFQPERKALDKEVWKKTLKGIVTNPIIIGIVAGLIWSALKIPMPRILNKAVSSIGAVATPMGLMAMGATFDFQKALGKVRPAVTATFIKLVGIRRDFSPACSISWIPKGRTDRNPGHAWIGDDCEQFRDGKKYGT